MRSAARFIAILAAVLPAMALAQQAAEPQLTEQQLAGRAMFNQSCVVCHVRMQITNFNPFGPPLSKESLGGQEDVMRDVITNGTPNMPGFKYHFEPQQVAAIVAYLKTRPVPAATR
jgi:mono/diheme cytochrome c family protein